MFTTLHGIDLRRAHASSWLKERKRQVNRLVWVCIPTLCVLCASIAARGEELTQEQIQALAGKPCNVDEKLPGEVPEGRTGPWPAGKRAEKTGTEKTGTDKTGIWRLQGSFTVKKTATGLKGNIGFTAVCR
jgi:hypothetical protein